MIKAQDYLNRKIRISTRQTYNEAALWKNTVTLAKSRLPFQHYCRPRRAARVVNRRQSLPVAESPAAFRVPTEENLINSPVCDRPFDVEPPQAARVVQRRQTEADADFYDDYAQNDEDLFQDNVSVQPAGIALRRNTETQTEPVHLVSTTVQTDEDSVSIVAHRHIETQTDLSYSQLISAYVQTENNSSTSSVSENNMPINDHNCDGANGSVNSRVTTEVWQIDETFSGSYRFKCFVSLV